jgi:hypothetical protein
MESYANDLLARDSYVELAYGEYRRLCSIMKYGGDGIITQNP